MFFYLAPSNAQTSSASRLFEALTTQNSRVLVVRIFTLVGGAERLNLCLAPHCLQTELNSLVRWWVLLARFANFHITLLFTFSPTSQFRAARQPFLAQSAQPDLSQQKSL